MWELSILTMSIVHMYYMQFTGLGQAEQKRAFTKFTLTFGGGFDGTAVSASAAHQNAFD